MTSAPLSAPLSAPRSAPPSVHVLLDLDGTISDSSAGIGRSLEHAFVSCGYPAPTAEQIRSLIGPPFEMTLPTVGIPATDVERVLNGRGGVRPATVEKVAAAARALDYPRRLPEVQKLLGHRSLETTVRYYAQIDETLCLQDWQDFLERKADARDAA